MPFNTQSCPENTESCSENTVFATKVTSFALKKDKGRRLLTGSDIFQTDILFRPSGKKA